MLNTGAQELTWLLHLDFISNSPLTEKTNGLHTGSLTHSKPEGESALLPVRQQTRPGKCTVAAQPCCWCWSPPASAHQQWFCPLDPVEKAATPVQFRDGEQSEQIKSWSWKQPSNNRALEWTCYILKNIGYMLFKKSWFKQTVIIALCVEKYLVQ